MKKLFLLACFSVALAFCSKAQCLTDFIKLLPDQTSTYTEGFGFKVAIHQDILAVGAPSSDSLGFANGGIVYLFQKIGSTWSSIGVLKPSVSVTQLGFGYEIKITDNYILVGASKGNSGVYIFSKPTTGWSTLTESLILKPVGAANFGSNFDIASDEQTIVVADVGYSQGSGAFFVFHKQSNHVWSNSIVPQLVENPDKNSGVTLFGIGGIQILNNKIACATVGDISANGPGKIYIFNDASAGNFSSIQLEARLTETIGTTGSYGPAFIMTDEGVFKYLAGKLLFYQTPPSGTWVTSAPSCTYTFGQIDNLAIENFYVNYTGTSDVLYFTMQLSDQSGRLLKLTKVNSDWCGAIQKEILYTEPAPASGGSTLFSRSLASSGDNEIALSWTYSTSSPTAVAVGVFDKQPDESWSKQTLLKSKREANNFELGRSLWLSGNFVFSGATKERVLDRDPRGAVYIYQKQGTDWITVNKLSQLPVQSSDQGFGTDITGYGNSLAIAAYGYAGKKIFIYTGSNGDFSNPTLTQTLLLPNRNYNGFGNMIMNDQYLIVPATVNLPSSSSNLLMLFKKGANNQWVYKDDLMLGSVNIILKRAPATDLDGNTLIASDGYQKVFIIEYEPTNDSWSVKNTLQASDPDTDPFFPPITFDASYFGNALKIDGDKIFVGAPGKNINGINDVGAIYLYTKQNGKWNSGTETKKLLPAAVAPDLYFGFSIDVLENTLITGGPSLTQAGKVFVLQSKDYYWTETIQLLYLEGDTFVNDYYGYCVALSKDDFFITAPLENNAKGKSSGTVYATTPPPIVKLVPPVCIDQTPFTLFGYPFSGTWSGDGIMNASTGLFNPAVATVGVHELTYNTPNCFYIGKLLIEVKPLPTVVPTSPVNNILCQEGKTTTNLSMESGANQTYQWNYQENAGGPFTPLGLIGNAIPVSTTKPGTYRVVVNNGYCSASFNFTVSIENLQVTMETIDEICNPAAQHVALKAQPTGGTWQLNQANSPFIDQNKNILSIAQLIDGNYTIQYHYTSPEACVYHTQGALSIDRIKIPDFTTIGDECVDDFFKLKTAFEDDHQYGWYYLPEASADTMFLTDPANEIDISETGFYGIITTRDVCRVVSEPIFLERKEPYEVFVPNVFTPNGDNMNSHLKVVTTGSAARMVVFNRYGTMVFQGDGLQGWDGGNAPTGVYYWLVSVKKCETQEVTYKGWAQLLR